MTWEEAITVFRRQGYHGTRGPLIKPIGYHVLIASLEHDNIVDICNYFKQSDNTYYPWDSTQINLGALNDRQLLDAIQMFEAWGRYNQSSMQVDFTLPLTMPIADAVMGL